MIKLEYRPWTPDSAVAELFDPPVVEIVTMTLGDGLSWDEAVCEFKNFLRASGYVIPYDFEKEDEDDHYFDCSDPPDMDKSGSLGDRQPEWAMRMSEDDSDIGVASVYESNTDVAEKRKRDADLKIGAWLSAALEDPSTCQSMKDDINEWFECTPQVHRNTMHP